MIAGVSYKCVPATGHEKPPFHVRRKPEPSRMQNQTLKMNLEGGRLNLIQTANKLRTIFNQIEIHA